jgi:hypothetical protein
MRSQLATRFESTPVGDAKRKSSAPETCNLLDIRQVAAVPNPESEYVTPSGNKAR